MASNHEQILKGALDGCILFLINESDSYGYELARYLQKNGIHIASEGTIYPVLLRLEKKNLLSSYYVTAGKGPKRKYYSITDSGKEAMEQFKKNWEQINQSVSSIIYMEV
ncbi:PadR family transcriptional regulator [Bacillus sp. A116_S68]|nr:PadR family transcriptional regulator [Bacillus sp. A116_S68]